MQAQQLAHRSPLTMEHWMALTMETQKHGMCRQMLMVDDCMNR